MAARWGTGEEMINPCKMEYFLPAALEEAEILQEGLCGLQHNDIDTGDAFEVLQGCLDSSILSIFDGAPTGEVKSGIDFDSEATLLTALTEILDSVDDETLSPFDTLPEMEHLQGQRSCEHSPRGNEDEVSFSQLMQDFGVSSQLDLCLPISLEQDGEMVPITLSDLVKHMHPYAMTLCVEGEEQLLPEGGIILEVMDKGEHGEPILAIQDPSYSLPLASAEVEQCVPESNLENAKPEGTSPVEDIASKISAVKDNKVKTGVIKQPKKGLPEKCLKKRKRKSEKARHVEGRVLSKASSTVAVEEPNKECEVQKRKKKVTFASDLSVNKHDVSKVECSPEVTTVLAPMDCTSKFNTTANVPSNQAANELTESHTLPVLEEKATSNTLFEISRETNMSSMQEPAVSQPSEPKHKSLSLQQYRLLRQQKKPVPMEKIKDNSTKWPTLPEAPKELPPIPCLPDPNPKDTRRASTSTLKEPVAEIMPAWQPRGPGAPPTPEALLVPPASMLASSRASNPQPVSPKTVSSTKPAETRASPMSMSTVPNAQKLPDTNSVAQNTNQIAVKALSVATTNGDLEALHVTEQVKCLQVTPSASDHVTAGSSKAEDTSTSQDVTEISTGATTNIQTFTATSVKPSAAIPLKTATELTVESKSARPIQVISSPKPTVAPQRHVAPIAAQPFSSAPIQARIMKLAEQMRKASAKVPKAKSSTAELVESFTSEIGIVAADLASLLEQFEETQPKEKQSVPEVCGGAAAVGNSSLEQAAQTNVLKVFNPDLASTADLTPPATPPHQMWKPLTPVTLLGKQKSEMPKPSLVKAIQIDPLPLPASKLQSKSQTLTNEQTQHFSTDHDYCLPHKEPKQNEEFHCLNGKQQTSIIIKSVELPLNKAPQQHGSAHPPGPVSEESLPKNGASLSSVPVCQSEQEPLTSIGMVTPDASPDRMDSERYQRSERSPSPYLHKRGRSQRKYRTRLPSRSGSMSSSSRSRSPPSKRHRSGSTSRSSSRSSSRSCSRSPSPCQHGYFYSSSQSHSWSSRRSRSRSLSRSRSRSPPRRPRDWDTHHSLDRRCNYYDSRSNEVTRKCKEKAIEERRVVYVGRIHGGMTRKELRERFSFFGEIEDCTVHFREHGDNYGFVTYYNKNDAFNAIENGSKLRQSNELPFDLCFGGRRQFCGSSYADLDSNRDFEPASGKGRFDALDFDTLLKQAQRKLKR